MKTFLRVVLAVFLFLSSNSILCADVNADSCGKGCPSKFAPNGVWPEGTVHSDGKHICLCGNWVLKGDIKSPVPEAKQNKSAVISQPANPSLLKPEVFTAPKPMKTTTPAPNVRIDWYANTSIFAVGGVFFVGSTLSLTKVAGGGLAIAAIDGPLPIGDIIAVVYIGAAFVYVIAKNATLIEESLIASKRSIEAWAIQMAQNPPLPPAVPGFTEPSHLNEGSRWYERTMVWRTALSMWSSGKMPDFCGRRSDGAYLLGWTGYQITRLTGGRWIEGLWLIVNVNDFNRSTAVSDPQTGSNRIIDQFIPGNCPQGPKGLIPAY